MLVVMSKQSHFPLPGFEPGLPKRCNNHYYRVLENVVIKIAVLMEL